MHLPSDAVSGRASMALMAPGALIAGAFWAIAWLEPRPGEPIFMAAIGVALGGYVWASLRLAANAVLSPRIVLFCCALAVAWRVPLLAPPEEPAHDAVRYVWDARVVRAGLNPYETRPDDAALQGLHSDVTREVDAAWLPTIYPPGAQLYFLLVTAVHESITAFRIAALLSDVAIMAVLAGILRASGQPLGWALLYAWHPLVPLEGASGAHLDFAGVLLMLLSWLALIRGRSTYAALAFAAAVLVKPLPIVLAPLYWRRIRVSDALLATILAASATVWIARGSLPLGSMGAFVDAFRFNGPLFAMLVGAAPARVIAAGAILAGLLAATYLRRTRVIAAPEAWAWPMALALLASPVIYPWYLIWLVPFTISRLPAPVWVWTLSVLAIYPTWHLRTLGDPFAVPPALLFVEFGVPLAAVAWFLMKVWPYRRAAGIAHDRRAQVAVIVPALNEEETIETLIRRVPCPASSIFVVDNGSTDATAALATRAGARVVPAPQRGYGRACLAGIGAADADVFVFLDADLSENPEDMFLLVEPIEREEADLVLGARDGRGRPWHARIGTSLCVWLMNRLWRTRYEDLGPFRAIRASSLHALDMRDQTWGWTIEMQVKAAERGLRCMEVRVVSGPRAAGQSKISGSLVGTMRAAGRMLEIIARLRLTRRSRDFLPPAVSTGPNGLSRSPRSRDATWKRNPCK